MAQEEVTYEQVDTERVRLLPWVEFIQTVQGDEFGRSIQALYGTVDTLISANDYEAAADLQKILDDRIKTAKQNWLDETVEELEPDMPGVTKTYRKLKQDGVLEWPKPPSRAGLLDDVDTMFGNLKNTYSTTDPGIGPLEHCHEELREKIGQVFR